VCVCVCVYVCNECVVCMYSVCVSVCACVCSVCVSTPRSQAGFAQVGVAIPSEYFLHKKGAKLLSQSRNIPVRCRLRRCRHTKLYAGTWNVHSLVEDSGDRQVCHAHGASRYGTTMERKLDLLVAKLKSYNISIPGIQETKWFGSDIWPIGEWTFLHLGHELPPDDDIGTSVGIQLDNRATAA